MQPSWVAVVWKCSQPVSVARLNTHQQNVIALMREWEFWLKYFQWLRRAKHSGPSIRVTCWCYSFLVCAHAYVCGYCLLWHSVFPVCSETHYSSTAWMLAFQVPFLRRLHCTLYDFILQPNVSLQKPQKKGQWIIGGFVLYWFSLKNLKQWFFWKGNTLDWYCMQAGRKQQMWFCYIDQTCEKCGDLGALYKPLKHVTMYFSVF